VQAQAGGDTSSLTAVLWFSGFVVWQLGGTGPWEGSDLVVQRLCRAAAYLLSGWTPRHFTVLQVYSLSSYIAHDCGSAMAVVQHCAVVQHQQWFSKGSGPPMGSGSAVGSALLLLCGFSNGQWPQRWAVVQGFSSGRGLSNGQWFSNGSGSAMG